MLAALGYASLKRRPNSFREGVLYIPDLDVDAFFVTLQKSEADYSPSTMYRDYPISPTLFHWESQSVTTVASTHWAALPDRNQYEADLRPAAPT